MSVGGQIMWIWWDFSQCFYNLQNNYQFKNEKQVLSYKKIFFKYNFLLSTEHALINVCIGSLFQLIYAFMLFFRLFYYCEMKTGCRCFVCFQSLEHLLYLLLFGFGLIVKHYNSPPQAIVYIYMNTKRDYVLFISFVIPYRMYHFLIMC